MKKAGYSNMLIRVNVAEVCDARDDDSSNAASQQIKNEIKGF